MKQAFVNSHNQKILYMFIYAHVCAITSEARRGCQDPWSCRQLWLSGATEDGTELPPSAKLASPLNCQAIFLAPNHKSLKNNYF